MWCQKKKKKTDDGTDGDCYDDSDNDNDYDFDFDSTTAAKATTVTMIATATTTTITVTATKTTTTTTTTTATVTLTTVIWIGNQNYKLFFRRTVQFEQIFFIVIFLFRKKKFFFSLFSISIATFVSSSLCFFFPFLFTFNCHLFVKEKTDILKNSYWSL